MIKDLGKWVDDRLPVSRFWNAHLAKYYVPHNFNFWYYFGSLLLVVFVLQIVTGIWLTMSYKPSAENAFASVEYIMRDVEWGWLLRYMHSTGASFFFIAVYLHIFRGMMYGSYKKPRELIWIFGVLILLVLMAEAFMGYLLPWGQMSYWGAQVIISLFSSVPVIGPDLALWVRGDYVVSDATLNRFFALHVIALPLVLLFLIGGHIMALHEVGSNNPDGVEIKENKDNTGKPVDGIPFHPYYTVKDLFGLGVFMFIFAVVLFYWPDGGGLFLEHPNFTPADPLKTPEHIAPVWYFAPHYAILRAIPDKFLGVVAMVAAILILFVLPWLDRNRTRSIRYRSTAFKVNLFAFAAAFIGLGYLGTQAPTALGTLASQILSAVYFGFFVAVFFISRRERTQPVPERLQ
ncbi:cytochrome b N-terminal domain-containing protein [Guyparkeria halopsychrophila]|uniref:cytochrome b n=1 Tax=Guyparkeria halopsychrophila TaxID=3139421 RepID=UPI0037C62733